jgi:pyruvate kinase
MLVSRFRTPVDIVSMTTDPMIWRRLSMSWGVTPILADEFPNMDVMFYFAKMKAQESLNLAKGSNVIITGGPVSRGGGNTNTIKIETV